jgi:hypothetical protein
MKDSPFYARVELLLRVLHLVAKEEVVVYVSNIAL